MLDKWLPDDTLLKLANEIGLSETAFLVANHIRWFTPKVEVPLCGHATLATAFVLKTINKAPATSFKFHSLSGETHGILSLLKVLLSIFLKYLHLKSNHKTVH
ncbi:Uncharacterized isomerase yddE [Proteus mirabilis]|uniref:Uncharacterized isomerase yddE n=1 Tax=Proteus mirabilis TaxID=584 RepID=A0A379GG77_PROMI|nr:Uncharacterized isomerase yddE [Proteus mirabilis]